MLIDRGQAQRRPQWIDLGFAHLQPSELAKLVFALWGAHVLALRERYLTTSSLLVPVLPVFGVLSLLLIAEPDFGAVVTPRARARRLLWAGGHAAALVRPGRGRRRRVLAVVVTVSPDRMERLTSFLDPFADPTDGGFQAIRGFYALATGGLWGVGLGNSAMKWNLLPHAESDYIFAIIGEELGFLGLPGRGHPVRRARLRRLPDRPPLGRPVRPAGQRRRSPSGWSARPR